MANDFYEVKNNLFNKIMCNVFQTRNMNYNLRSETDFIRTRVNTSTFGLNSLKYLAAKTWDFVLYDIKSVKIQILFKKKIINW